MGVVNDPGHVQGQIISESAPVGAMFNLGQVQGQTISFGNFYDLGQVQGQMTVYVQGTGVPAVISPI